MKKIITMVEVEKGKWMSPSAIHSNVGKQYEQPTAPEWVVAAAEGVALLIWLAAVGSVMLWACWPA